MTISSGIAYPKQQQSLWQIRQLQYKISMNEHYHIPIEDLMAIQVQIGNKIAFEALAKAYAYDQNKTTPANLKALAETVADFLRVDGRARACLMEYFVEKNMPIEVTFRPLRADQLQGILEEWVSLHTESSTIIEKLYSNNHRNILFKRVLFDEREAIDDYFRTLSEKGMLRGVDLYQLLVDILSPYHLYEFDTDAETFFDKVNSLNSFLAVVARFVHSEKRISVGINAESVEYIRRFEFDRLIQFWEGENPELVLLAERRKNHLDRQTQTTAINSIGKATQTDQNKCSLPEIINETLRALNKLTVDNNSPAALESIQRIYSFLRREKIQQLQTESEEVQRTSQKTHKIQHSPTSRLLTNHTHGRMQANVLASLFDHINQNQTVRSIDQQPQPVIKLDAKLSNTLRSIYKLYFSHKNDLTQFRKCLNDISVESADIEHSINCVAKGRSTASVKVSEKQFQLAIIDLMNRDRFLTASVLQEFLNAKLDELAAHSPSNRWHSELLVRPHYRLPSSNYRY